MNSLEERVKEVLETVRPYLKVDGGDLEFIRIMGNILEVRFTGECATCPMAPLTLRAGIERAILRELPEIKRVESV